MEPFLATGAYDVSHSHLFLILFRAVTFPVICISALNPQLERIFLRITQVVPEVGSSLLWSSGIGVHQRSGKGAENVRGFSHIEYLSEGQGCLLSHGGVAYGWLNGKKKSGIAVKTRKMAIAV